MCLWSYWPSAAGTTAGVGRGEHQALAVVAAASSTAQTESRRPSRPLGIVSFQKVRGLHAESFGDPDKHEDARVPSAALDATGVGKVDLRFERQLLLR